MSIDNNQEFVIISGVGLLGKTFKCSNKKELLSYIMDNFSKSPNRLRVIVTQNQETREFICLINEGKMITYTEPLKNITPEERSIEEGIALIAKITNPQRPKESEVFDFFKFIIGALFITFTRNPFVAIPAAIGILYFIGVETGMITCDMQRIIAINRPNC